MYKQLPLKRIGDSIYFVHYLGWVWNSKSKSKKEVSQQYNTGGYKTVMLYDYETKKSRSKMVHRLVAQAYIPNPENKRTVNHKDGVKDNNHLDNLEWMTHKENLTHAVEVLGRRIGIKGLNAGIKHGSCKLTESQVLFIRKSNMTQKELAEYFKVSISSISLIINRINWKHI